MVKEKKVSEAVCLIKGCGGEVKSRGLCSHHYAIAGGRVKMGKETWDSFEKLGLALPPSSGRTGVRVDQFNAALAAAREGQK